MKHILFPLLFILACKNVPGEGGGSGGGSGADPVPVPPPAGQEGIGQGGGLFKYQPCDKTCSGECMSVPDGDKTIGICAAPCQTPKDCPEMSKGIVMCQDHKCGLSCGEGGTCPAEGMKCVNGICGYPLPAPQ